MHEIVIFNPELWEYVYNAAINQRNTIFATDAGGDVQKIGNTPESMLSEAQAIMKAKNEDYTTHSRFENFERANEIASWFKQDSDKAYVILIGVKLARLASLLGRKEPNNESINDTFRDLINYSALWGADVSQRG